MQCRNCSGNDFKQTKTGNYRCSYCSTLYYEEPKKNPMQLNINHKKLIVSAAGIVIMLLIILVSYKAADRPGGGEGATEGTVSGNGSLYTNENRLPAPEGDIMSVDALPDSIGNVYFLAMCRNTGKVAMNKPMVTVRLLDEKGEKLASGKGYAFADRLNPGEVTPVYILVTSCPPYKKYETDFTPELPYIIPEGGVFTKNFTGEFMDVSLKQTDSMNNHKLRGKIKNTSQYDARYVQVAAVLYDKNDRVTGYGATFISEKTLKPGNFDFFEIYLSTVISAPEYYKLYYEGNVD